MLCPRLLCGDNLEAIRRDCPHNVHLAPPSSLPTEPTAPKAALHRPLDQRLPTCSGTAHPQKALPLAGSSRHTAWLSAAHKRAASCPTRDKNATAALPTRICLQHPLSLSAAFPGDSRKNGLCSVASSSSESFQPGSRLQHSRELQ